MDQNIEIVPLTWDVADYGGDEEPSAPDDVWHAAYDRLTEGKPGLLEKRLVQAEREETCGRPGGRWYAMCQWAG